MNGKEGQREKKSSAGEIIITTTTTHGFLYVGARIASTIIKVQTLRFFFQTLQRFDCDSAENFRGFLSREKFFISARQDVGNYMFPHPSSPSPTNPSPDDNDSGSQTAVSRIPRRRDNTIWRAERTIDKYNFFHERCFMNFFFLTTKHFERKSKRVKRKIISFGIIFVLRFIVVVTTDVTVDTYRARTSITVLIFIRHVDKIFIINNFISLLKYIWKPFIVDSAYPTWIFTSCMFTYSFTSVLCLNKHGQVAKWIHRQRIFSRKFFTIMFKIQKQKGHVSVYSQG